MFAIQTITNVGMIFNIRTTMIELQSSKCEERNKVKASICYVHCIQIQNSSYLIHEIHCNYYNRNMFLSKK